jgi:hypothetical protein
MSKPALGVSGRDAKAGTTCNPAKGDGVPRSVLSDVLLLERPARLNGVQVRRVRRQVDDTHAARGTCRDHARVVMGGEVVQDEDIAGRETTEEASPEPSDESAPVGRLEHRVEHDPAREADSAEQREIRAPVHRQTVDVFAAALHPGMAAAHREVEPGLVEKYELVGRHTPDLSTKRRSLGYDVWPQTLQRSSAFFFTTYP